MKHLFTLKSLLLTLVMLCGLNAYAQTWEEVSIDALTSSDVFLIVDTYSGAALINSNGTGSAPTATSVMTNGSIDVSKITEDMKWNISGNSTDGYVFTINGNANEWLYCKNANNGVRVGTGADKTFTFDTSVNRLKNNGQKRWLGAVEVKRRKRENRDSLEPKPKKRRPEWLRFLLEETPATLLERYRRNRRCEK